MNWRLLIIANIVCTLVYASPGNAGVHSIFLSSNPSDYSSPFIEVGNGQLVTLYVVTDEWPGHSLGEIRFAIPTPPCATLLTVVPPPTSGSIETGAIYDFGTHCVGGRTAFVRLQYRTTVVDTCCPVLIQPYQSTFPFHLLEGSN
jgi:hypothetical protein